MDKKEESFEEEILRKVAILEKKIPENRSLDKPVSVLDAKIIALLEAFGKPLAPKEVFESLGEKSKKWYSDRLWALAQKGAITNPAYGFYQCNPKK